MRENHEFLEHILKNRFLFFALLIITFLLSFHLYTLFYSLRGYEEDIRGTRHEISTLRSRNEDLKALIAFLSSDAATEDLARKRLGWKKEGETALIVTLNEGKVGGEAKGSDEGNAKRWLRYFVSLH